jgi:HD-like signal output (HDOD) protein
VSTVPADDGTPALADVRAADGEPLESVVKAIEEISTLPAVALRVIQVASDPESSAVDLKTAMEADPALCVRVLRCVNSASFGLREQVEDLARAVAYLGFNQIRDLAITATVGDLFNKPVRAGNYDRAALWTHLVAVGVAARMIATRTRAEGHTNAFLAGLLHDLGIILFEQRRPATFKRVMQSLDGTRSLPEVERRIAGWDHTELGETVARNWRLPAVVCDVARWHHAPDDYRGPHAAIVHSVAVANLICTVQDKSSVGWNLLGLGKGSLDALGVGRSDLRVFTDDLEEELQANRHLFELQSAAT